MARLEERPAGYQPALELYCRLEPEGGPLCDPAKVRGPGGAPPPPRAHCVLLVHGYNNHDGEAAAAYLGFRERAYDNFPDLVAPALERTLGDAYWPGDARWPGPVDWIDFIFYPDAVPVAVAAGQVLAEAIRRIPDLVTLDVVAHSLGCRVALETIAQLRAGGGPALGRLCLMAAAVPCEFVEDEGRYEPLLRALQGEGVPVRVLHSTGDSVLRFAFPFGQSAAGEATRGALGYEGPPPGMPGLGANVSERRMHGAGHGDYWGHEDNEAAARDAGAFLKLGQTLREPGEARALGEARRTARARAAGEPRRMFPEPLYA